MIRLHAMTDGDFAWLLGEDGAPASLRLCQGGFSPPEVIAMLRGVTEAVQRTSEAPVAWLIVADDVVVGMASFTRALPDGRYEFGYGVAPTHEGRGITTQALALLLETARVDGRSGLTAETSIDNPASQRVLEKNGFVRSGARDDPEDGQLTCWSIDLAKD
jgi:RimJ/RimL family protein N-acetyltransferase